MRWNELPGEVVDAGNMQMFDRQLNRGTKRRGVEGFCSWMGGRTEL